MIRVAQGHNNASGLMQLTPEPNCPGVLNNKITYTPSSVRKTGKYTILSYPSLTAGEWDLIMGMFGLTSAESALVTVALPNSTRAAGVNYNGQANKPEPRWENPSYKSVEIYVVSLVAI